MGLTFSTKRRVWESLPPAKHRICPCPPSQLIGSYKSGRSSWCIEECLYFSSVLIESDYPKGTLSGSMTRVHKWLDCNKRVLHCLPRPNSSHWLVLFDVIISLLSATMYAYSTMVHLCHPQSLGDKGTDRRHSMLNCIQKHWIKHFLCHSSSL